jgi:hypothetical protein
MTTCKTCKHWKDYGGNSREWENYSMPCEKLKAALNIEIDQGEGWDSGDASVKDVETKPTFGCNLWEEYKP